MLSRSVSDAARALGFLRAAGAWVVVEEVSDATGLSRPSLAKLMSLLVRKGFVTTRRGVGGGVSLARPAGTISLFDLCRALDDPILEDRCLFGGRHASAKNSCAAAGLERRHHAETIAFLKQTTVLEFSAAFPAAPPEAGEHQ